jgi:hypothetical protein
LTHWELAGFSMLGSAFSLHFEAEEDRLTEPSFALSPSPTSAGRPSNGWVAGVDGSDGLRLHAPRCPTSLFHSVFLASVPNDLTPYIVFLILHCLSGVFYTLLVGDRVICGL